MLKLFCILIVVYFFAFAQAQSEESEIISLEDTCTPVPGLFIENRTREIECCDVIIANLYRLWSTQRVYLSKTLATLKSWNCTQLDQFCSNRSLAFTEYTALMYDRFCDESQLFQSCRSVVASAIPISANSDLNAVQNWTDLVSRLDPLQLTPEQIQEPCIQVALYDTPNGGPENYHELVTFIVPFCESAWCAFDFNSIERVGITPWLCLPTACKANVIILAIIFAMFSVLIIAANFTVILVYATEKKSRHSQGVFRLNLGIADFMVGLIVFPSAIAIAFTSFQHQVNLLPPTNVTGLLRNGSDNSSFTNSSVQFQMVEPREEVFQNIYPNGFLNVAGFFSTLSLTVSIYLLTVSGIDRLQAISRPVVYQQHVAKRFATISSIVAWVLAFAVSLLPVFISGLQYTITATGIVTLIGQISLILYSVGFFLPLVATWIIASAMFFYSRKSFKRRATMSTIKHQQIEQQRRLNLILSLMVTTFSVSIIPTILVLILVLFLPGTNQTQVDSYSPLFSNVANSLESVATITLLCNSLWNCIIYSVRTKNFRKSAGQKYRAIWRVINPISWCKHFECCKSVLDGPTRWHKQSNLKSVTTISSKTTNAATDSIVESQQNHSSCRDLKCNSHELAPTGNTTNKGSFEHKPEIAISRL